GVGASEEFGRAFRVEVPPVPSPESFPVSTMFQGRPVFISPTLAFPAYRASVWLHLERVVVALANGAEVADVPAPHPRHSPTARPAPTQHSCKNAIPSSALDTPAVFKASAANLLVRQRMHAIEAASGLRGHQGETQARLDGPKFSNTTRVVRH